jgi:hypothetical protein
MVRTTRIASLKCLDCGKDVDAATDPAGGAIPGPGDATICLYCGHIMIYTDQLTFRNPNDAEMYEIAGDKRILSIQQARNPIKKQFERIGMFDNFPNDFRHELEADGFEIIEPDGKTFRSFSLNNWNMASFLARKSNTIYVALLHAKTPRRGSFKLLCREITAAKLEMVVITPLGPMKEILTRWGFKPRYTFICGDIQDVWFHAGI